MYQYLENLRRKPDHHKHRFAIAASTAITAMIFLAWASIFFPANSRQIVAVERAQRAPNAETPFATLKKGLASVVEASRGLFSGMQSDFNFEEEYNKMKVQVESGVIQEQMAPSGVRGQ